ncbi:MAG: small ribosomal subunit Rsm22 family protein, partial [Treponemataceae bacterium]|nr:small ribosomal subunit Rsm22 family protein [Treponemataceae bacterium]
DACLDVGSGPLTAVIALWLARPELRNRRLTWYCLDFSQNALSFGEELYLSVASKARPSGSAAPPHWEIVRVKGEAGTRIRRKAALVTCANLFNEINQSAECKPSEAADAQLEMLLPYMDGRTSLFVCEPGMPSAAHFISLLRERFIARGFSISLPCPHEGRCPMYGQNARFGGSIKWCNFSFTTESAPPALMKLSAGAGIPKERAVISFLLAERNSTEAGTAARPAGAARAAPAADKAARGGTLPLRISSDPIWLPEHRTGFYACGEHGLTLVVARTQKDLASGMLIRAELNKPFHELQRDKKTGAAELVI